MMWIEPMTDAHSTAVLAIYHRTSITATQRSRREHRRGKASRSGNSLPNRYVATDEGRVLGWVAASAVSNRPAYSGAVEHSVYVDPAARGRSVGRSLLQHFIASTEAAGIWTIQSGIFPENPGSLALQQSAGIRETGRSERIGRLHGRWRDVILVERRSAAV